MAGHCWYHHYIPLMSSKPISDSKLKKSWQSQNGWRPNVRLDQAPNPKASDRACDYWSGPLLEIDRYSYFAFRLRFCKALYCPSYFRWWLATCKVTLQTVGILTQRTRGLLEHCLPECSPVRVSYLNISRWSAGVCSKGMASISPVIQSSVEFWFNILNDVTA